MKRSLFGLVILLSFLSSQVFAQSRSERYAAREFAYWKVHGEFERYIVNQSYLEVLGTDFIALEKASGRNRICLFGFFAGELTPASAYSVQTHFVCFAEGLYELRLVQEYREDYTADPAGISIGIGNIRVTEPSIETFGLKNQEKFFANYPKTLIIETAPKPLASEEIPGIDAPTVISKPFIRVGNEEPIDSLP